MLYLKVDAKALLKQKAKGNVEQFGGSSLSQSGGSTGGGGRPTPVTMDNLKG